nr:MAG TPA: Dec protein, OB-Fold, Decoration, VIRAL PROTEIN [Caudoviricetes sp.]
MEYYSNVVKAMIARSNARAADIADKIQARAYYQFQYDPPAGPLPGWSMEQQTEDAINEIGNIAYSADEIARETREIAQQAYNAAQAAIEMATNAITAAQNAQQTADTALNTANTAVTKADNAQASADAAQKAADAAQKSANDAQTSADNAQSTANTAIENASQALLAANEAKASADHSNQRLDVLEPIVDTLRWYENVTDNIDFNTRVELERAFLQGTANTNGPVAGPGWLDVDDDYNETYIRHKFIAQADGACYVRFGTIVPDSSPIEVSSWTGWVKYALASELTSAVETINTSITSINGEITTIKGDITSIESDITELQGSLGSAEGDITAVTNALNAHKADYDNPHKVTAAQLGLATVYKYKGSVETYADLPTSGQQVGDVYNVKQADPDHNIEAGDNVAWDGTTWDILAGDTDLSGYAQLNSANTFKAMNAFRANIAVSNGTASGTGGSISFGISPTGETVQARIGTDTLGGLFYNTSTNQPHVFRIGNNLNSFVIRDNGTTMSFSNNNNIFANVIDASGVAKWLGNAATATKLATARTINGVPFDGTQNITIEAGQGTFLPLTGGTVTGPIYLPSATPTTDTQAVTKKYVDDSVAGAGGGDVTAAGNNNFTGTNTFNKPITVRDGALAGIGGTITLGTKPNSATTQAKINSAATGAMYYTATEGLAHFFNVGTAEVATIGGTATTATLDFLANSILKYSTSSGLRVGGGGTSKIIGFYPEAADNTAGMRLSNQAEAISTDYSIFSLQNNSAISYTKNAALQVGNFKILEVDRNNNNVTIKADSNGQILFTPNNLASNTSSIDSNGNFYISQGLTVGSTLNTGTSNGVIRAGNNESCLYFTGTAENTYYSTPNTGNTISYQQAANVYLINTSVNNAASLTMNFSGMNFKATVGSVPYMCKTLTFWFATGATAPTVTWQFPSGAAVYYPKGVAPSLTANASNIINVVAIVDDTDSFSIQVCDVVALPHSG